MVVLLAELHLVVLLAELHYYRNRYEKCFYSARIAAGAGLLITFTLIVKGDL